MKYLIYKSDNSFLYFFKTSYCCILYFLLSNSLILIISDLLYKKIHGNFFSKLSVFSKDEKSSIYCSLNKNSNKYFPIFIYKSIFLILISLGIGVEPILQY